MQWPNSQRMLYQQVIQKPEVSPDHEFNITLNRQRMYYQDMACKRMLVLTNDMRTMVTHPYMTFDLTLLGTIYVQVPKDHLYQV